MIGSEDGKMKRSEIERYVAPALRDKFNEYFEEKMACATDFYASEAPNTRIHSLEYRDSSRRPTDIVPGKVRCYSSSSSNPRNTSYESNKDDDSSDFEECCSVPTPAMSDEEISMGTNEKNSDEDWKKERRGKPTKYNHDSETENHQTSPKIPNRIFMEQDDSDLEFHANQVRDFESNETKPGRRVFFNSDDSSISDIETLIDDHLKIGRLLTSTPYSDIDEQNVLDAAKIDLEGEDGLESTLLSQSETTINTNRNNCGNNFEIYQDPASVTNHSTDFTAMFGNNYIPPPVPRPAGVFQLPLIHRLPIRSPPSIVLSAPGQVPSQKRLQSPTQIRNPRSPYPPSLQLCSRVHSPSSFIPPKSSHMSPLPRYGLSPRLQLEPSRASNPSYIPSSLPPILSPQERISPPQDAPSRASNPSCMFSSRPTIFSPQERFNPRTPQDAPSHSSNTPYIPSSIPPILSPQERISPPQDASISPYFNARRQNSQDLESNEQEDSFYIPPPVPPPQQMTIIQLIRNLNQHNAISHNVESCQPYSISLVNKNVYGGKICPQNSRTRR